MAYKTLLTVLLILNVLANAFAARDIPKKSSDKLQPEIFVDPHDGSVLVPGIGRFIFPKKTHHHKVGYNPFTYNPVTGRNDGHGLTIPTIPTGGVTGGAGTPAYIPGGDDTGITNPGFEVPTGALPTPPARH